MKKILTPLILGTTILIGCGSQKTEALNFPLENALVVSHTIKTNGQITKIDRLESQITDSIINADGSLTYRGLIGYSIRPNKDFVPSQDRFRIDEMPAIYGPNGTYWQSKRLGTVIIK